MSANRSVQGPAVSVIIPAYNVADYLDATLQSAREQTFTDWEVVLIDDGSTDGTLETARRAAAEDPRITVYARPHGGVSCARNFGLSVARGEWVVFLDADDLWLPHTLAKLTGRQRETGALLVYGAQEYLWPDGRRNLSGWGFPEGNILRHEAAADVVYCGATLVNRAYLLREDFRFSEDAGYGEDMEFLWKLLTVTNVAAVPEVVHVYRHRPGSATTTVWSWNKYRQSIACYRRTADFISERYAGEGKEEILLRLEKNIAAVRYQTLWWRLKCADDGFVAEQLADPQWQESLNLLDVRTMPRKQRLQYWLTRIGRPWLWRLYRRIYGTDREAPAAALPDRKEGSPCRRNNPAN